jgi:tripartite-type tricarboxylate transporter receptor subunit TctC
MKRVMLRAAALGCAVLALGIPGTFAQNFPDKPVKLVVPYQPGGATDAIARALGKHLSDKWKQPVIIDNRPGASGVLGASAVVNAEPDGHTLLICDSSVFVVVPHLMASMSYDPKKDLAPVTIIARQPPVLTTRKGLPVSNTKELLAYIKANPGKVNYGSFGVGTWAHVAMEELNRIAGLETVHVPFRGGGQVLTEMLAERIDVFFATMGAVTQYKESGALKILATATEKRIPSQPDLPTMAEDGLPGYSLSVWFAVEAPAKTPTPILDKIQKDIADLQNDPEFRKTVLEAQALQPGGETREQFAKILDSEFERWGKVVDQMGMRRSMQ